MALLLRSEFHSVDIDKVIAMCLIHDMGECFTGDIPAFEKTGKDRETEDLLLEKWVGSLPKEVSDYLSALYKEMNEQQTTEAKMYKALDKLEAVIHWYGCMLGRNVVSLVRWGTHETYDYCFDGNPKNSMVMVSTVGGDPRKLCNRLRFEQGLREMEITSEITIQQKEVNSVITKTNIPVCDYAVNPYVGCTHACKYCYASFMKRFTGHSESWGGFLDVKYWTQIKDPQKYAGKELFFGTVTDPYNPQEAQYCRTIALLQELRGSGVAWAIKANEISPEEYLAGKGKEYRNTPHLKAYSHEGKPCPVCGKLFVRIVVGGRSSCYCPECQKK